MVATPVADCLFLDTETNGLNPNAPQFRCLMVAWFDGKTGDSGIADIREGDITELDKVQELLRHRTLVCHNIHFDAAVLERLGVEVPPPSRWECTYLAAVVALPGMPHGLKPLARLALGKGSGAEEAELKAWGKANKVKKADLYWKAPAYLVQNYCLKDVELCARLYAQLSSLGENHDLHRNYRKEVELVRTVLSTEQRGFRIDLARLREVQAALNAKRDEIEAMIWACNQGAQFNLNSPPQVARALYKDGMPARFTAAGNASVDKVALLRMAKTAPMAKFLLQYRQLEKLQVYVDECQKWRDGDIIRAVFKTSGAEKTRRMSSSNPNLQNIPRPDEKGAAVMRSVFIPRKGYVLLAADYSQIELRIGAMYANDYAMMSILAKGGDIHKDTSLMVFGTVDDFFRQLAKTLNFLIFYGGSADRLMEALANRGIYITLAQAREYVSRYRSMFPGIPQFFRRVEVEVAERGGVTSVFGDFYAVPRDQAYKGVNYLVQGTCAQLLKRAIRALDQRLPADVHMVSYIHDEILFEARKDVQLPKLAQLIRETMEYAPLGITVSTPVEVKVCTENWAKKTSIAS